MIGQNNVTQFFVAKNIARTAVTGTYITKYTDLADGEVVVTNNAGAVIDDSATSTSAFRIVARTGNQLQFSDVIDCTKVKSYDINPPILPQPQIDFVGSNGTSGSLDIDDATAYRIYLEIQAGQTHDDFARRQVKEGVYKTAASGDTQYNVADGLFASLVANFERDKDLWNVMRFGIVNAGGTVADFTGDGKFLYFVKGSTTVTVTTDAGAVIATNFAITAGNLLYVPSETGKKWTFTALDAIEHEVWIGTTKITVADAATAADGSDNQAAIVTAINASAAASEKVYAYESGTADVVILYKEDYVSTPPIVWDDTNNVALAVSLTSTYGDSVGTVYEVAATVSAGAASSFTLTRPYQGETTYCVGDGTSAVYNTGILTAGTNYGIKLYTLPQPFVAGKNNYNMPIFRTAAIDFGSSTSVTSTAAKRGVGSYKEVGDIESQLQLNRGAYLRSMVAKISEPVNTVTTNSLYNYLTVTYVNDYRTELLGSAMDAPKTLLIAGEIHATATTSNQMGSTTASYEGIADTLDEVILNGNSAMSAQIGNLDDAADL